MRALNPFDKQRSYRPRNSAVAVAVITAVAAGGGGLDGVPFRKTSAQEGELETGVYCVTSCCRIGGDPAGKAAPTNLPASGGAELRGARLGVAGRDVASGTASPLSARVGVRWRGVRRGVAVNVDRPSGSALLPPSPPGGKGNMASAGLGVCLLTGRGGLLTTGVSSQLTTGVSSQLATGLSSQLATGVSSQLATGVSSQLTTGVSSQLTAGVSSQLINLKNWQQNGRQHIVFSIKYIISLWIIY
jgi:hypothetical protein